MTAKSLLQHQQMSTQQNQLRSDGLWWSVRLDCCAEKVRQHKKTLSRVSGMRKRNTICEEQMCR